MLVVVPPSRTGLGTMTVTHSPLSPQVCPRSAQSWLTVHDPAATHPVASRAHPAFRKIGLRVVWWGENRIA